ncbi:MAG: hypothetical protein ACTHJ8_11020 [Mucilaginibacter sp.]
MRKLFLYITIIPLLFVSCKKDQRNPGIQAQKKYAVKFSVTGFTQQIVGSVNGKLQINNLQSLSNSLDTTIIGTLYYIVYDSNGNLVTQITRTSGQANFGNISDELPAGTYHVNFGGGKTGLLVNPWLDGGLEGYRNFHYPNQLPNIPPWSDDFFFKQINLTISSGNVSQDVSLERVTAKLTVNIQDALPSNADHVIISVNKEYYEFPFGIPNLAQYGAPGSISPTFVIPSSAIGTTNYKMSMLMMNTVTPFTVKIDCYDSAYNLIGEAIVNNVSLQRDTQTILSGKLFGSGTGVNTGLNTAWDQTPITISF